MELNLIFVKIYPFIIFEFIFNIGSQVSELFIIHAFWRFVIPAPFFIREPDAVFIGENSPVDLFFFTFFHKFLDKLFPVQFIRGHLFMPLAQGIILLIRTVS